MTGEEVINGLYDNLPPSMVVIDYLALLTEEDNGPNYKRLVKKLMEQRQANFQYLKVGTI